MREETELNKKSRANRPARKKLTRGNVLTFGDKDPDYVYRVFNDEDGRIKAAQEAWWEIVESGDQLGDQASGRPSKMGSQVRKNVGGGVDGVLMRIPKDLYEQDQAEKQAEINKQEDAIKAFAKSKGHYGEIKIGSTTPATGPKIGTI
jgi:hypothetical protein